MTEDTITCLFLLLHLLIFCHLKLYTKYLDTRHKTEEALKDKPPFSLFKLKTIFFLNVYGSYSGVRSQVAYKHLNMSHVFILQNCHFVKSCNEKDEKRVISLRAITQIIFLLLCITIIRSYYSNYQGKDKRNTYTIESHDLFVLQHKPNNVIHLPIGLHTDTAQHECNKRVKLLGWILH